MYLHSSRRQTSLLRYTRKGYAYIGVSQSLEVVASILVGDYLSVNLIRILNTQFLSRNVMQKQLFTSFFRHYNMDNNHYAIAKVQKVFGNIIGYNGKNTKNSKNIWNLLKDFISLHRQKFAFDYAAECGE